MSSRPCARLRFRGRRSLRRVGTRLLGGCSGHHPVLGRGKRALRTAPSSSRDRSPRPRTRQSAPVPASTDRPRRCSSSPSPPNTAARSPKTPSIQAIFHASHPPQKPPVTYIITAIRDRTQTSPAVRGQKGETGHRPPPLPEFVSFMSRIPVSIAVSPPKAQWRYTLTTPSAAFYDGTRACRKGSVSFEFWGSGGNLENQGSARRSAL